MDNTRYIIDTVSLSKLSKAELEHDVVQKQSNILDEVLYEFRDNPNLDKIQNLVIGVNADLLTCASMLLQQPEVQALLNLYQNEGNGDVLILAKAVLEAEAASCELFPTHWMIITDDKNLLMAADANKIKHLNTPEFKKLLA